MEVHPKHSRTESRTYFATPVSCRCGKVTDILKGWESSYLFCAYCGDELRGNTHINWQQRDDDIEDLKWFDDLFGLTKEEVRKADLEEFKYENPKWK